MKSGIIFTLSLITYLFFCANMSKSLPCPETKRLFNQQNTNKSNQILEKIDINLILNKHNPDYAFESPMNTYSKAFDVNFSLIF